jgi:MoxR-like ATPase
LRNTVNIAIAFGRPLLIRGEPGTGKTMLAHSIARDLKEKPDRLEHKAIYQIG